MKVKEYLVNRILELEAEVRRVRNEKAGTVFGLQKLEEDVAKLKEKIEQYQIEREHIRQIITCNINLEDNLVLTHHDDDFKTLLAIFDIKIADHADNVEPAKTPIPDSDCGDCKYQELGSQDDPCINCFNGCEFVPKEVIPDAENTD